MGDKIIAGGAWAQVVIDGSPVGMATNATYTEDWGVAPANVVGYLGPMDYDSQNYSCQITIGTFMPEVPGQTAWPDGGAVALSDLLPNRAEVQSNGGKPGEFDLLQFLNKATGDVIAQFRKVMITNNGAQINPNTYITANVSMLAIERVDVA